jgi:hypothetical protein
MPIDLQPDMYLKNSSEAAKHYAVRQNAPGRAWMPPGRPGPRVWGAVAFIHCFGCSLNEHVHFGHQFTRIFSVVTGLQADPALRIGAKEGAQAQRGVQADSVQAFDDLIDAPGWHVNRLIKQFQPAGHGTVLRQIC